MTLLEQEWRQLTQAATVAEGPLFCREIHFLSTVDSTNEEVRRRAEQRAPHGSVYVAEQQTFTFHFYCTLKKSIPPPAALHCWRD